MKNEYRFEVTGAVIGSISGTVTVEAATRQEAENLLVTGEALDISWDHNSIDCQGGMPNEVNSFALIDDDMPEPQNPDSLALEKLVEALAEAERMTAEGNVTTALHIAAYQDDLSLVQHLLSLDFDHQAEDFNGQKPLHIAVAVGSSSEVMAALLAAGFCPERETAV